MQSLPWYSWGLFPSSNLEKCSIEELHELKITLETMQDHLHQMERARRLAELQAEDLTPPAPWLTRITFHRSELLLMLAGAALFGTLLGLLSLLGIFLLSSRFF